MYIAALSYGSACISSGFRAKTTIFAHKLLTEKFPAQGLNRIFR